MDIPAILSFLYQSVPYYLGLNLFLLFGFAFNRFACYIIRDWPSVTGTVTRSEMSRRTRAGSHGPRSSTSALIVYTYEVNGESLTNQRIAPGLDISGSEAGMVRRFPVGAQVTVYYDPKAPGVSFLSKKSLIEPYLLTYFILGNLFMPLIVMFMNFMKATFFRF